MNLFVVMATNEVGKEIKCGEFTSRSEATKFLKSKNKSNPEYKEFWIEKLDLSSFF